jgi:hypothetical protein
MYEQIVNAIHSTLEAAHPDLTCLPYSPTSIDPPTLYTLLDRVTYSYAAQRKVTTYRILHRLCLLWQDNEMAELELMPYVDSIPAAIVANKTLGGLVNSGGASMPEAISGFLTETISGVEYRVLNFISEVVYKEPYP